MKTVFFKSVFCCLMLAATFTAQAQFSGGTGAPNDPYIITSPAQLDLVRNYLRSDFKLDNDIDMNNYLSSPNGAGYNGGAGWNPIGDINNPFGGIFDGAGHKITNIYINRPSTAYVGLFAATYDGTLGNPGVCNLGVEFDITGGSNVGGIAGDTQGTIQNCYITGSISGSSAVGGLVGYNRGTVKNCYNSASINGTDVSGQATGKTTAEMMTQSTFNTNGPTWDFTNIWIMRDNVTYPLLRQTLRPEQLPQLFCGGDGTTANPYLICAPQQLAYVLINPSANYQLANDIDLTVYLSPTGIGYNDGAGWIPIGTASVPFTGTFNGAGHSITNIYIYRPSTDYVGLFGNILGSGAKISNLAVEIPAGNSITGNQYVGGIVGINSSTFNPFPLDYSGTVSNCNVMGGEVIGNQDAGGVVGVNMGTVSGCSHSTTVYSKGNFVGGVAGENRGMLTNCCNTGTVSSSSSYIGGVIGNNGGTITNCYNSGVVIGNQYVYAGGVAGYNNQTEISNCFYDKNICNKGGINGTDVNGQATGKTTAEMMTQSTFTTNGANWDFTNTWKIQEGVTYPLLIQLSQVGLGFFCGGDGSAANPYLICTPQQLDFVRINPSANYQLANDIDLTDYLSPNGIGYNGGAGWNPIGTPSVPFTGTFDGAGYMITNIYINSLENVGLFGDISGSGAKISNLGVEIAAGNHISGYIRVGGLVGYNDGGEVSNCYVTGGGVNGIYYTGGVVGSNVGTITNCYNNGLVELVDGSQSPGGVVGNNEGTISFCYNSGTMSGVSGIVGIDNGGTVTACFYDKVKCPTGGINGTDVDGQATGKTTDEMMTQSTFTTNGATWDFTNTWMIVEGNTYPFLSWQKKQQGIFPLLFCGGDGTATNPFLICTPHQLDWVRLNPSENYKLANDIDLTDFLSSSGAGYNGSAGWNPIGDFTGTFEGAGHKITNIYINRTNTYNVGLFGNISGSGAKISNLGVEIAAGNHIRGYINVGGIVGYNNGGEISNCYVSGGEVTGIGYTGGLVGDNEGTVSNCYNNSAVSVIDTWVGGVVGNNGGTLTNCYNSGAVSYNTQYDRYNYPGGGVVAQGSSGTVVNCFFDGNINSVYVMLDLDGNIYSLGAGTAETTTQMKSQATFTNAGWDFTNTWIMLEGVTYPLLRWQAIQPGILSQLFCGGDGTTANSFLICTPQQLDFVRINPSANYQLTNDIDFTDYLSSSGAGYNGGAGWNPIGTSSVPFTGTFNGAGHTIINLTINRPGTDYIGLFGYTSGSAKINSLGIENADITGSSTVGGVAGTNGGSVENCYVTGAVSGKNDNAGGVVGVISSGALVQNCYNRSAVSGTTNVGGVAGYIDSSGKIINCYSTGAIVGDQRVGGVAGDGSDGGSIINCAALNSTVKGQSSVGRVIGVANSSCTLSGNRALNSIGTDGGTTFSLNGANTATGIDGEDITVANAVDPSFWSSEMTWDTETIWLAETGKLPILRGLDGQDGTPPAYLINMAIARIGAFLYYTLQDALDAVQDGETITILKDVGLTDIALLTKNNSYTLDLNGHALSNNGNLTYILSISSGVVAIKNGSILNTFSTGIYASESAVTLEDLNVNTYTVAVSAYALPNKTVTVNILSGDYNSSNNSAVGSGGDGSIVTITSGHFKSGTNACLSTLFGTGQMKLADGSTAIPDPWLNINAVMEVMVIKGDFKYGNVWTGATSGDWNDASNWSNNVVPTDQDVVTISGNATHFPALSSPIEVAEIHFEPGAQLGGQNNLTYQKAYVQYDLSKRETWNMLSIPLMQAYPGDFTFGGYPQTWVQTFQFSEGIGSWVTLRKSANAFSAGDGFVVWLNKDDNPDYPSDPAKGLKLLNNIRELPFFQRHDPNSPEYYLYHAVHQAHDYDSGTKESTFYNVEKVANDFERDNTQSYTVDRTDAAAYQIAGANVSKPLDFVNDYFALAGNPYMAVLDLDALYQANQDVINGNYHVWVNDSYKSYSATEGAFGNMGNLLDEYIAPLQGFIVEKSENATSDQLNFTEDMTTVDNTTLLRSSVKDTGNKLIIDAVNPAATIRTIIVKRDYGQDEFGNKDSRNISNGISNIPEIYTLKPSNGSMIATGVNIINKDDLLVPVGLATSYAGEIKLSFSGMDTYDARISFIDADANREIDLTGLASFNYAFDYNGKATACEDRFFIRISKTATGMTEPVVEKVNVFESNGLIHVVSGASNLIKEVTVYSLQGALIYKESSLHAISHTVERKFPNGVYIVNVVSEKSSDNFKLRIKN